MLEEHLKEDLHSGHPSAAPGALAGAAELANKLIGEGQTFEDICFALGKFAESTYILFSLASLQPGQKRPRQQRWWALSQAATNMRVLGRRTSDSKIASTSRPAARPACWPRFWSRWTRTATTVCAVLISECGNQTAARLLEHGIL